MDTMVNRVLDVAESGEMHLSEPAAIEGGRPING